MKEFVNLYPNFVKLENAYKFYRIINQLRKGETIDKTTSIEKIKDEKSIIIDAVKHIVEIPSVYTQVVTWDRSKYDMGTKFGHSLASKYYASRTNHIVTSLSADESIQYIHKIPIPKTELLGQSVFAVTVRDIILLLRYTVVPFMLIQIRKDFVSLIKESIYTNTPVSGMFRIKVNKKYYNLLEGQYKSDIDFLISYSLDQLDLIDTAPSIKYGNFNKPINLISTFEEERQKKENILKLDIPATIDETIINDIPF